MSDAIDGLLRRRDSWTGAAVQDLLPGSQMYGHFFRVAYSQRDPETGDWEIRWGVADEILKPIGEPIYRFDGSTWDLPAYAVTVFPRRWVASTIAGGVLLSLFWGVVSAPSERGPVIALVWVCTLVFFGFVWFTMTEPVRGTKVAVAASVALVAHSVHAKRAEARRLEDQHENPGLMVQYLRTQEAGPARDAHVSVEQQAQILANQHAIADRIGLILPDSSVQGWHR